MYRVQQSCCIGPRLKIHTISFCSAVDARAQFKVKEWTDAEYQAELEHIEKVRDSLNGHSLLPCTFSVSHFVLATRRSEVAFFLITWRPMNMLFIVTSIRLFPSVFRVNRSLQSL